MAKETHVFELIAIDQSGTAEINTVKSMAMGLSYSDKLWKKPTVKTSSVEDKSMGISLSIHKADNIDDETEAAFILKVKSQQLDTADEFRYSLLHHIKDKLEFTNIRVLKDSVSETLAKDIYLKVAEAESTLRNKLALHFMKQDGLDWWSSTATKSMINKVEKRKSDPSALEALIDNDIVYTDLEDLTQLAQRAFGNKNLEEKLSALTTLKEQTTFNKVFEHADVEHAEQLVAEATALINGEKAPKTTKKVAKKPVAKKAVDSKKVAASKQPATQKATTPKSTPTPSRPASKPEPQPKKAEPVMKKALVETPAEDDVPVATAPKAEPKQEAKKDLSNDAFMMITESKLLDELKAIEADQSGEINIKNFVKDTLARKGYMSGPAFGLAESMKDKGLVDIYETKDDKGFMIKVIRSN